MDEKINGIIKNYTLFKNSTILKFKKSSNQGLCNSTYFFSTKNDKFVLKRYKEPLNNNVSKKFEFQIQLLAYKKDLAPKPFISDIANQIFICGFIEGEHKTALEKLDLNCLAKTLYTLHKIKFHHLPFNIKKYITKNNKIVCKELKLALLEIKKHRRDFVLCHNDLNPANIIFSKKAKFIDWEFANTNDRYFDLASVIIEFNLNTREENYFLRSYFKKRNPNKKKLKAYKIIYKHICKIWFDIISKKGIKCQEQF